MAGPVGVSKKKVSRISLAHHPRQERIEQSIQISLQRRYRQLADYYIRQFLKAQDTDEGDLDIQDYIDEHTGDIKYAFFLLPLSHYEEVFDIGQDQYDSESPIPEEDLASIAKRRDASARMVAENRISGIKAILNDDGLTEDEKKHKVENYLGVDENQPNYTNPSQMYAMSEMQWALNAGILAGIKSGTTAQYVNIVNIEGPCEEICIPLIEKNPYPIEEAETVLPAHSRCRCKWVTVK